jgi:hypothetical protein
MLPWFPVFTDERRVNMYGVTWMAASPPAIIKYIRLGQNIYSRLNPVQFPRVLWEEGAVRAIRRENLSIQLSGGYKARMLPTEQKGFSDD